jgi:hypothetical protein
MTKNKNKPNHSAFDPLSQSSLPVFGFRARSFYNTPGDDPALPTPPTPPTPSEDPLKAPGLKALEAERQANKQLQAKLKELEDKFAGIDPDAVSNLKKTAEEREQAELEAKQQYAAALKAKEDKYQQEIQAVKNEAQQLQSRLKERSIEQAVIDSFVANGGKRSDGISPKEFVKMLMPAISHQLDLVDGEVVVVDREGNQAWHPETFKPMTIDDLMTQCRTRGATASLFEPIDKANGAGAKGNSRISGSARSELDKLSGAAKLAKARELGLT